MSNGLRERWNLREVAARFAQAARDESAGPPLKIGKKNDRSMPASWPPTLGSVLMGALALLAPRAELDVVEPTQMVPEPAEWT